MPFSLQAFFIINYTTAYLTDWSVGEVEEGARSEKEE